MAARKKTISLKIHGSRHAKSRAKQGDAITAVDALPCPTTLRSKDQKAAWLQICGLLKGQGRLCAEFSPLIEMAAERMAFRRKMQDQVDKKGATIRTEQGQVVAPWARMLNAAIQDVRRLLKDLGLTPDKIGAMPIPKAGKDATDRFFQKGGGWGSA